MQIPQIRSLNRGDGYPWLLDGDQNTRYFYSKATQRRKKNLINKLKDERGNWHEGEQRDNLIMEYFRQLFTASEQGG